MPPFRQALFQPDRFPPQFPQPPDRVVGVHAVGTAAGGDDGAVGRQLVDQLVEPVGGTEIAPGMCPAVYSGVGRTSMTITSPLSSRARRSSRAMTSSSSRLPR